jgi:putative DNA primase/helicase
MSPRDGTGDAAGIVGEAPVIPPVDVRRVADIVPQPIRWLWPATIARGKVTLIAGHPGLGKSQLALALAGIVTAGGRWPVSGARAERGAAVILSAEDDPADTIRPRLDAAGADLTRCHVIGAVREADGSPRGFAAATDLPRLAAALAGIDDPAIVIVDPITAYLGGVDTHRNADVRAVLAELAAFAARTGVAVVAISHLRKAAEGAAILSVTGSLAFVAAARAAYLVVRDRETAGRILFVPAKNNIGDDRTGYAYRIDGVTPPDGIATSRLVWEPEPVTISADDALAAPRADRSSRPRDIAADWLRGELAAGPVASETLRREAIAAGLSWGTVRRAADDIGVIVGRVGGIAGAGQWTWMLPDDDPPDPAPEPRWRERL